MVEPEAERRHWEATYAANRYDTLPWFQTTPPPFLVSLVRREEIPRGRSMDVGCGAGTLALWLAKKGYSARGIDIAPSAIRAARLRAKKTRSSARFRVASAYRLPVKARSLDLVTDFGFLHTQPARRRPEYARELARVVRAGGAYVVSVAAREERRPQGPPFRLSVAEVVTLFESAFELVDFSAASGRSLRANGFVWRRRDGPQPPPFAASRPTS
ncbi:MAG TPA: class I SAM-dependent methyltransferase [Thermoplasmata archaeon]|nr:class I SAM-dependent methyltransferase [Thermoplasmata archaeon]